MCPTDAPADADDGRDGRPVLPPGLTVQEVSHADQHTIVLAGELDLRSRPLFDEALARVRRERASILTLDLSGVAFMDSTGLHGVLAAKAMCAETGRTLLIVRGSEQVQRLFELSGVLQELQFGEQTAA